MKCEWDKLLAVLPLDIRSDVDRQGREDLQELRVRLGRPTQLVKAGGEVFLEHSGTADDLNYIVNTASRYSPWAAASSAQGYITAPGGHRIGLCGEVAIRDGEVTGIRTVSSLCIRVARDFPGIGKNAAKLTGNLLIAGPPGSGKTTLLRDLIRLCSNSGNGSVAVVDEREELFPPGCCFDTGCRTDILSGCGKPAGIDMALRTLGPKVIAMDEITSTADCDALEQALWCGVRLLATVHAASKQDLLGRGIYSKLVRSGHFDTLIILRRDKSWSMERM